MAMKRAGPRIGLMVPNNNTTMEAELPAWLPGSTCRALRIPRGGGMLTPRDLPDYLGKAIEMAKVFADDEIDLVIYGCTAAGFLAGPERDAGVAAEIAEVTGKPVVTTASAMIVALRDLDVRNIALITPYPDLVNERLRSFLVQSGVGVEILASFRARTVDELAAITPAQIAELSRGAMRPGCDAAFIACSQLPTREILPDLEREFGRPVWSSIKATAWSACRAVKGSRLAA